MRKNKQLIVDSKIGDCFRACLMSILDIPNSPKLPNVDDPEYLVKWHALLYDFGLTLSYSRKSCWTQGYWIARVQSLNFAECTHAIVMFDSIVAFDPSTKKRYRIGKSLLGQDIVMGGHSLRVVDAGKLYKIERFKRKQWRRYFF